MQKMKITAVKPLEKLNYLYSYLIEYKDKRNKDRTWEFVSRHPLDRLKAEIEEGKSFCDGATIFATDRKKEKVVLIKEFRVSQNRYVYSLPAGLSDENENIKQTAVREFKEETGLDLDVVLCDKESYTSVGLSNEKVAIVYGYFSGEISLSFSSDNEDIEVIIVDKTKAIKILEKEEVPIRTMLLLKHFYHLNSFFSNEK